MAITLHGLTRYDTHNWLPAEAFPDTSLDLVSIGDLSAIVTRSASLAESGLDAEAEIANAIFHHELLTACAGIRDIIPARFGTVFSSVEAVETNVQAHSAHYADCLDRTAGRIEYALHLTPAKQSVSDPATPRASGDGVIGTICHETTGREFLARQRASRDNRRRASAQRQEFVERALAMCSALSCALSPGRPNPERILDVSLLLRRSSIAEFERAFATLQAEGRRIGVNASTLGPWPVYSFCTGPETEIVAAQHRGAA